MKQRFAVLVLASVALASGACGGKKPDTTPRPAEHKSDATGGAAYGGARYGHARGPAANPCSPAPAVPGSGS